MAGPAIPKIYCWEIASEELTLFLASTAAGALRVALTLQKRLKGIDYFGKRFPGAMLSRDCRANAPLIEGLRAALGGVPMKGDLPLDVSLTPFQWRVLKAIRAIPFGATRTYGEVASMLGTPGGARAVGQALGKNPLPLIFP